MSKLSEAIKEAKERNLNRFFGEIHHTSNTHFTFKHYQSDDEIIIVTNNVREVKGNQVLIVSDNQAVYLKDWNVLRIMNWREGVDAFAIKLNRKYFKPYTFSRNFEDFAFETPDTFDSLVEVAKEQDAENMPIRIK